MAARLRAAVVGLAVAGSIRRVGPLAAALVLALSWSAALGLSNPPLSTAACGGIACYTLTIHLTGDGSGSYVSSVYSDFHDWDIACEEVKGVVTGASTCAYTYTDFGLGVHVYTRWQATTGSCWYVDACQIPGAGGLFYDDFDLTSNPNYGFEFRLKSFTVNIGVQGGPGSITVQPIDVFCPSGSTCSFSAKYGDTVTIQVSTPPRTIFLSWNGNCAGQGNPCHLTITAGGEAFANVGGAPTPSPSPTNKPPPTANPTPSPPHSSAPTHTPAPTVTVVPTPSGGLTPGSSAPQGSVPPSSSPATVGASPTASATLSTSPGTSSSASGASPSGDTALAIPQSAAPTQPSDASPIAAAGQSDLTPVALAILGAGVFVGLAILIATYLARRRRSA